MYRNVTAQIVFCMLLLFPKLSLGATPKAPSSLSAPSISSVQINLAWKDNSNNETNFSIERRLVGGPFYEIALVGSNVTSYNNSGLNPATTYEYRVRAKNASGFSNYSNTVTATTYDVQPIAPSLLTIADVSPSSITVSWQDNSSNESNFVVERAIGSSFSVLATVAANVSSYVDSSAAVDTVYSYRVRASNSVGYSQYSNIGIAEITSENRPQRIFVTSTTYSGNLGGIAGADLKCATAAQSAQLPGTWKALNSDSSSGARDRVRVYINSVNMNPNGAQPLFTADTLFPRNLDISPGNPVNAINYTENGQLVSSTDVVWVGTYSSGIGGGTSFNCNDWETGSIGSYGNAGRPVNTDWWISAQTHRCNTMGRLYCIEMPTRPTVSISLSRGSNDGDIAVSVVFPTLTNGISRVDIRRSEGTTFPAVTCDGNDTLVQSITSLENQVLMDHTNTPGTAFSYRACLYDNQGRLASVTPGASELSQGGSQHQIFITSKTYVGFTLGGVANADSECQTLANGAGLSGNWSAILSDQTTSAKDHVGIILPVVNIRGETIALSASAFWNRPRSQNLMYQENNTQTSGVDSFWSGSNDNGTIASVVTNSPNNTCSNWTGGMDGAKGYLFNGALQRIGNLPASCGESHRLLCISQ